MQQQMFVLGTRVRKNFDMHLCSDLSRSPKPGHHLFRGCVLSPARPRIGNLAEAVARHCLPTSVERRLAGRLQASRRLWDTSALGHVSMPPPPPRLTPTLFHHPLTPSRHLSCLSLFSRELLGPSLYPLLRQRDVSLFPSFCVSCLQRKPSKAYVHLCEKILHPDRIFLC